MLAVLFSAMLLYQTPPSLAYMLHAGLWTVVTSSKTPSLVTQSEMYPASPWQSLTVSPFSYIFIIGIYCEWTS